MQEDRKSIGSSWKEVARLPKKHPQEISRKAPRGVRGPCVSPAGETVGEAEQLKRAHVPSLPSTA